MPLSYKNFGQKLDNYIIFQEYNKYTSSHIIMGLAMKFKLNDIWNMINSLGWMKWWDIK